MKIKVFINGLVLIGLVFFISACSQPEQVMSLSGNTMGTTYHIKIMPSEKSIDAQALQVKIDKALEEVNDQMSTYRPDSELSRFNQMSSNDTLNVSADTVKVINEAIKLYKITDGALDITLGPLVNLWGFGPDKRPTTIPTQVQIDKQKARTGIQYITVNGTQLSKGHDDLYVDLSSIAKGFGVDKVAAILEQYQFQGYLVEIGGEIRVKGTKDDNQPWVIAVEQPSEDGVGVQQVLSPGDMSMATSGDYRNYYEEDGQQFSHLIDPRTGYPIKHRLASVTVLDKDCMVADGYATAMMVLGTQASLALAKREDLAIMLIEKRDDGFKVFYSNAFKPYISQ
ncbi:FAD:protein FMN transferase [Shewanella surugensis]|uniref:FAD:protein FMN transferase n=1 Tax=Shewanella surugensis TaxID=212020 RepID=A0ABT0LH86_9GAMM|nr:FAD:protein FMN transferase [Shewanella surugensis]MCL1127053.1 FAD:protein FMN transferase [Shewanella surugensis]